MSLCVRHKGGVVQEQKAIVGRMSCVQGDNAWENSVLRMRQLPELI